MESEGCKRLLLSSAELAALILWLGSSGVYSVAGLLVVGDLEHI